MKTAFRATVLIAIFSILSKILGAARQAVLANQFGAGAEIDIYVAAFRIPDLIFNLLILGTLSAAFIPVFVRYLEKDRKEAFLVASSIFNWVVVVMGALSLLGFIFAPIFVDWIVPGFSQSAKLQTVELTRIMMLSPFLFSLSSVLTSVLHSYRRFLLAAIVPLFYNLSIIGGVFFLYPRYGLSGLAWGVVLGAALHFLLQLPAVVRLGLKPLQFWNYQHPGVKKIGRLFLPRVFGIELGQISFLTASVIASGLAAGSLSVFYFAYDLNSVPLGVFAISFAVASFPNLSELASRKKLGDFKDFLSQTLVQILFLIIPISVITLLLRAQIVRLLLGIGEGTQFDFSDTRMTAQALGFFALSMFAQGLIPLLARAFYALENTTVPVIAGLISAGLNIVLAIVLVDSAGVQGLAIAFSVAVTFNMIFLFYFLHRKIGSLRDSFLFIRTIKILIASIVMAVATFVTLYLVAPLVDMQTYRGVLIQALSGFIVAVAVYLLFGFILKLPEAGSSLKILRSWLVKFTRPVSTLVVSMFTELR